MRGYLVSTEKAAKLVSLGAILVAVSSCGIGKKMVKDLNFVTEKVNEIYYTGFDTTVDLGGVQLPATALPIHAPKHPETVIGQFKIDGSKISVRVDLAAATKVNVLDGKLLPNGNAIPIGLPDGVMPIAFPIKGTSSLIYLALGSSNIMAGAAITLKADIGGTIGSILKSSLNLFFPFAFDTSLTGSVGVFSGSEFGLGVFAVKALTKADQTVMANATGIVHTMDASLAPEVFEAKTQMPSKRKSLQFYNAVSQIERVELK